MKSSKLTSGLFTVVWAVGEKSLAASRSPPCVSRAPDQTLNQLSNTPAPLAIQNEDSLGATVSIHLSVANARIKHTIVFSFYTAMAVLMSQPPNPTEKVPQKYEVECHRVKKEEVCLFKYTKKQKKTLLHRMKQNIFWGGTDAAVLATDSYWYTRIAKTMKR